MKNKKIIMIAGVLAGCFILSGCANFVSDLVHKNDNNSSVSSSDTSDNSESEEFVPLTGPITTNNAVEDLKILTKLAMPSNFQVTMNDHDSELGDTNITMAMNLAENASVARFTDFSVKYKDLNINVPTFDLYIGNGVMYLSENAMCASLALDPQFALLTEAADSKTSADRLKEIIEQNNKYNDAVINVIKETDKSRYIKLTSPEAAIVPVIYATPISSGMISGFFGKDFSYVADLFTDDIDKYCRTEGDTHIFEVNNDNAIAFYDRLLSLDDDKILGLVMIDTYDDPLWSSLNSDTWLYYGDVVQKRIDAYKDHWKECQEAVKNGEVDYKYKLSFDIESDTEIFVKLEMNTIQDGVKIDRVLEIKTIEEQDVVLPDGSKILAPEQWDSEVSPIVDKYFDGLIEGEIVDAGSSTSE